MTGCTDFLQLSLFRGPKQCPVKIRRNCLGLTSNSTCSLQNSEAGGCHCPMFLFVFLDSSLKFRLEARGCSVMPLSPFSVSCLYPCCFPNPVGTWSQEKPTVTDQAFCPWLLRQRESDSSLWGHPRDQLNQSRILCRADDNKKMHILMLLLASQASSLKPSLPNGDAELEHQGKVDLYLCFCIWQV